ncbi:chromosomal replication initiator protein DnaA [Ruminobacter sp. RM87]|uniref:chromosomal replication initiator protein DnaA n=1 Tax=Ruminobacter sp. RM87 TaxID=1200567 RepID=UPI0004E1E537|nr:chromosomal replication initiator protein DnaA [Ruminobacter sp. RM87]
MASLELWENVKRYLFSLPLNRSLAKLKIFLRTANVVIQDNTFSILVPNRMIKGLLVNEFMDSIVEAVRYVSNKNYNVAIEVQSEFSVNKSVNLNSPVRVGGNIVNNMSRQVPEPQVENRAHSYQDNQFNNSGMRLSQNVGGTYANNRILESEVYQNNYQQIKPRGNYSDLQELNASEILPHNVIEQNANCAPENNVNDIYPLENNSLYENSSVDFDQTESYSMDDFKNNIFYKSVNIQKDKNFDNFVEGPTNQNLCTNGKLVAKDPGNSQRNPFFIWGDSGLGKTHILNAIANEVASRHPEKKIILVTLDRFYQDFLRAVNDYKRGGINSATYNNYKSFYRSADVFFIDDIQQLENTVGLTKDFITLFDEIVCSNVQLIFAASQHPANFRKLDSRIRNRISSGVVIKVEPPDKDTRERIIVEKIKEMNLSFDNQSIVFLANKFQTNIRVLEGHIKTIGAYVTGTAGKIQTVTVDVVKEALKDSLNAHAKLQTVDNIKQVVAEYYGITVKDIDSSARPKSIAYARMMAMALARELTKASYPSLGKQFGNKDHSTVINAWNKVNKMIAENDPQYREDWENLKLQLTE